MLGDNPMQSEFAWAGFVFWAEFGDSEPAIKLPGFYLRPLPISPKSLLAIDDFVVIFLFCRP